MIKSLQIMKNYQRNPICGIDFIGSIKPHTINPNDVHIVLKITIVIYVLGKFIKVAHV